MNCYLISYDLRNQRDYDGLYKAIKALGTSAHVLESTWAVVTGKTADQVARYLVQHIDSDDGLFVVKSGHESAWLRVLCPDEWLKANL